MKQEQGNVHVCTFGSIRVSRSERQNNDVTGNSISAILNVHTMDAGTIGPARRVLDRGISHYLGDRPLRMVPLSAERRSGIAWRARRQPAGAKFLAGQHCRKTGLAITVPGASGVSQLLVNNL